MSKHLSQMGKKSVDLNKWWYLTIIPANGRRKGKHVVAGWHSSSDNALKAFVNYRRAHKGAFNATIVHGAYTFRLGGHNHA